MRWAMVSSFRPRYSAFLARLHHAPVRPISIIAKGRGNVAHGSSCRRIATYSPLMAKHVVPFHLHDIGEGITEVEILKWHVKEGDLVEEFDKLCEVQSDKSVVELTSPTSGAVHSLKFEEGQVVAVGQTLCDIHAGEAVEENESDIIRDSPQILEEIEAESSSVSINDAHSTPQTVKNPLPQEDQNKATRDDIDNYASLLHGSDHAMDSAGGSRFSGEGGILPSSSATPAQITHHEEVPVRVSKTFNGRSNRVLASPAVRTRASQLGVDIIEVEGTGEGGRVLKSDVEEAAERFDGGGLEGALTAYDDLDGKRRDEVPANTRVEFGRTRKVMWKAMGSMGAVPHFGYTHTLDLTNLVPVMQALNAQPNPAEPSYQASDIPTSLVQRPYVKSSSSGKTSILSILVKTMILALEEHPIMRARVKEAGGERWLDIARDGVVGIAVSDPKYGLLTPSLPPIHPTTTLSTITSHLTHLRRNASKPTPPPNLTISSIGALGESRSAMPVIPPGGGVAICAVGRARWETEWRLRDGSGQVGREGKRGSVWAVSKGDVEAGGNEAVLRCSVGWSGDHRVLEGAELIAFTETWKRYIEEPWRWIKVE